MKKNVNTMAPRVSVVEIAREARVAVSTASVALNAHPRVAPRTRVRVLEAAARLGYVPNAAARRLASARSRTPGGLFDQVGFVLYDRPGMDLGGPYMALMRGAEHEISSMHAAMVFLRVDGPTDTDKALRLVKAGWVDGWLVTGHVDDDAVGLLGRSGAPCVILGGHTCRGPVHRVDVDFAKAGRIAVERLAALGHRRVGFLGGSMLSPYQHVFLAGFRAAARELGVEAEGDLIQTCEGRPGELLVERLNRLLALPCRPTAIFMAEPGYASNAMGLLRQLKVHAPGEISVVGCEYEIPGATPLGFTRIEEPFSEVGRAGVTLLRELADRPDAAAREVLISPTFVDGCTTHPPESGQAHERPEPGSREDALRNTAADVPAAANT